jgi:putative RecB family exonuclease
VTDHGQAVFEGMPERLYAATPARLSTYLDCPRRYRYAYLQRATPARGAPSVQHSVGASVHTALARWWQLPRDRRTPEAGGGLLVDCWPTSGFRDDAQSFEVRQRTRGQVERYLAGVDPDRHPVAVERTVSVRTPRAVLWGRVDRVDQRPDGSVVVVDYKSGRSVLTVDDARTSLALAVYAAATAHTLHRSCTRVELHHLPTGRVLAWDHTEESLGRQLERADALAAELRSLDEQYARAMSTAEADEAFPALVASRCGWCEFRSACAPGRVVPPRTPWDGVADPE